MSVDSLQGGAGDGVYLVDSTNDTILEGSAAGLDSVEASASFTLSANVENLTLTGTGNSTGTGNASDNIITGNGGNNALSGLDGNDTLIGNGGIDTLDGGAGADNLLGNAGSDTLNGGDNRRDDTHRRRGQRHLLDGGVGADIVQGGTGNDILYALTRKTLCVRSRRAKAPTCVRADFSYTLTDNVENLTLPRAQATSTAPATPCRTSSSVRG